MKPSMVIIILGLGLAGCASAPEPGSERGTVLHSTVGGLRQAETEASAETGFWASMGDVGCGLVEFPVNLVIDIVSLPADLWRAGKDDLEANRKQHEYDHESDSWYEMARGAKPKE